MLEILGPALFIVCTLKSVSSSIKCELKAGFSSRRVSRQAFCLDRRENAKTTWRRENKSFVGFILDKFELLFCDGYESDHCRSMEDWREFGLELKAKEVHSLITIHLVYLASRSFVSLWFKFVCPHTFPLKVPRPGLRVALVTRHYVVPVTLTNFFCKGYYNLGEKWVTVFTLLLSLIQHSNTFI